MQTRNQNVVAAVEQELREAAEEGRNPSMQLIRSLVNGHLEAHDREATAVYQAPIAQSIYDIGVQLMGDSYQTRQQLARWTPQEAVIELVKSAFESGKLAGPGNDHVVLSRKELEQQLAKARKDGGDAVKAQLGLGAASATASTNGAGVGAKLYSQMSTEERQAMSPAERDAAVAYEAQQRSRG